MSHGRFGSRVALCAVAALTALAGCGHAHTVGPAAPNADPAGAARMKEARSVPKRQRATPDSNIEIASTPAALLRPGAARAIQERLVQSGELTSEPSGELDDPTRAALARFQRAHDLPATGAPDDATVKKLGLDAGKTFRSGTDNE